MLSYTVLALVTVMFVSVQLEGLVLLSLHKPGSILKYVIVKLLAYRL